MKTPSILCAFGASLRPSLLIVLFAFSACFAGHLSAAEAPAPRIVALTGETYPAALIIAVDPATGVVTYAYLKADGSRADSGNSIAKFTPVAPLAKENPGDPDTYPAISDATLIAAIKAAT